MSSSTNAHSQAAARAQIYTALALALTDPPPDLVADLVETAQTGAAMLGSSACARAARSLNRVQSLPRLPQTPAQRLRRAAMPPGQRPVALHESLHRYGTLVGASTQAVEGYFRSVGLAVDGAELPDHAGMELAFLSALAEAEGEARTTRNHPLTARLRGLQRRFLHEHPGAWLPAVGNQLARSSDPLYATVGRWLAEFLAEEMLRARSSSVSPGEASLPALLDVADCTLCGLCTGVCPTQALTVRETGVETNLVLADEACTACRRCAAICPEQVLVMAPAQPAPGRRPLRTSPRLNCPACGRPTVSQAEMSGILARLGAAAAQVPNLDLCIPCRTAGVG